MSNSNDDSNPYFDCPYPDPYSDPYPDPYCDPYPYPDPYCDPYSDPCCVPARDFCAFTQCQIWGDPYSDPDPYPYPYPDPDPDPYPYPDPYSPLCLGLAQDPYPYPYPYPDPYSDQDPYPYPYPYPYPPPEALQFRAHERVGPMFGGKGEANSVARASSRGGIASPGSAHATAPPLAAMPNVVSSATPLGRPLRIIHVGQFMVRAGIETWLKSMIHCLDPRRVQLARCIVTSPLSDPQVMREMGVPVEVGGRESVRRAARDCDILLVSGPAEVAAWLGDIRPAVCVGVAHGDAIWTKHILDRCRPAFDHVVAVSRAVQQRVCGGFPSTVIYNGIDTSHLSRTKTREEARARYGFKSDDFIVGGVMRLSKEKNPELLVEALAHLPPHFKLFLVGWGALRQRLLDRANDIAPLRCVFTQADQHLGDYYRVLDAFCLPSASEGFGLSTLEAQFCGLPVVTTRTGYAPELLEEGVHYLHCEPQASSIARCFARLQANPLWADSIAREGQRRAEQFGFASRMCREYEALFEQLYCARRPGPASA